MEGGLERPVRHSIDWKHPDYLNEELFEKELRRVADACHGCRRCVSLCNSFPSLFDLIDESETFEVDGVEYSQFEQVVDHCYLCDLCFLTKCPYVPPHEWEIDFPHLMLRAKTIKFNKKRPSLRDRILTSTDTLGRIFANRIFAPTVNYFNKISFFREILSRLLQIHRNAKLPAFSSITAKSMASRLSYNSGTNNKVAIYTTCYHNFNQPEIIEDLSLVLKHNNISVEIIKNDNCCGMPKLELGDLEKVELFMKSNSRELMKYVENGYKIIAPVPSCVLMFKQELPLMFSGNVELKRIAESIFDPFEYLFSLHKSGDLKMDFKKGLGSVFYQVACHQRVQNFGLLTKKVLELVPNTNVEALEKCSGHDGTYGVKEETHKISVKIARPITKALDSSNYPKFTSDCSLAGNHIANISSKNYVANHPISLIKDAYGLINKTRR